MHQLSNQESSRHLRLRVVLPLLCCLLICGEAIVCGQKKRSAAAASTPAQILDLGFFYYNNDDINDTAAVNFRKVISRFPDTVEAEKAQYYLGSYYQRKYYVQKAKYGQPPNDLALIEARDEYLNYTNKYVKKGTHQWLADAFFNRALVFLQLKALRADNKLYAQYELNKAADFAYLDDSIYVYQVVYSQSPGDVLDGNYDTVALAKYANSIQSQIKNFDQQIAAIRDWCRQRSPKQAR